MSRTIGNSHRILKGFPTMMTRVYLLAAALLAASFSPALADSVTANVKAWDTASRSITLEDNSMFMDIPAKISVPTELKAGDNVTVDFEASESGIEAYNSVTINKDIAKRALPPKDKRG
jgi:uncharacterized protein (DUF2147 family)